VLASLEVHRLRQDPSVAFGVGFDATKVPGGNNPNI